MVLSRAFRGKVNKRLVILQAYPDGDTEYVVGIVTCKHFSKLLIVLIDVLFERPL